MPFQDGVYYPYTGDTRSSAGIPSLLNSPIQPPVMTPSTTASAVTMLPFKFRPRRESVDWRRINAVDVDQVVSQLDVDALQEHIAAVTFCSLDSERCPRCQSPVDPALVKLLRLAQLTVEWLLHCQEFLALNLRAAEERLATAGKEHEQMLAKHKKQEEREKTLNDELKHRKKVIRTQQSLLAPRIIGNHKCLLCGKSFLNSAFLQNHMERRHSDEHESQLQSDSEKRSQISNLQLEIGSLKEQIVQQQQALQDKIAAEKEQQNMQKDLLRELERFKAEEMARMDRKIEDSRDGMRREMEFLYSRNIQALNEVNRIQPVRQERPVSPVQSQPEKDVDIYKEMQAQALQKLEQELKQQDKKWNYKMEEIRSHHESEKNQLQNKLSKMEDRSQQLKLEMDRRLQEKEQTIQAQWEQIRSISSNPPTKVVEVPVIVSAPPPEPKQKRVKLEEPVSALKLDPIRELSEEERDSSSISERRLVEKKPDPSPEKKQRTSSNSSSSSSSFALKRNPNLKREMRPELEQAVIEKLKKLGVRPDRSGLKNTEFSSVLVKVQSKRESIAKAMPGYWRLRGEISSRVEQKLGGQRRGSDPALKSQTRSKHHGRVVQIRPRSSSLPSRASQRPVVKQPKTPQPAPRTKTTTTQPKTSTPKSRTAMRVVTVKTPLFSSDEESSEETDSDDQLSSKHLRSKSPQLRPNQAHQSQILGGKTTSVQAKQAGTATQTAAAKTQSDEEDDDWSEVTRRSCSEIDTKQVQKYRDQNGNMERKSRGKESIIANLASRVERKIAERVLKKPAGGVSILPERKDEVQELTYTDLEENSDWLGSSVEDPLELQKAGPLRSSLKSPSTSVWGTSTGKTPKSDLTEVGPGNTLKSSLCSLSDISDSSEESGNKPGNRLR